MRQEIEDRRRYNVPPAAPPPQQREDFASDQVKDLLELYIRDPAAFDQYARTYYYGERAQRQMAATQHNGRMMPDRLSTFAIQMLASLSFAYILSCMCVFHQHVSVLSC